MICHAGSTAKAFVGYLPLAENMPGFVKTALASPALRAGALVATGDRINIARHNLAMVRVANLPVSDRRHRLRDCIAWASERHSRFANPASGIEATDFGLHRVGRNFARCLTLLPRMADEPNSNHRGFLGC